MNDLFFYALGFIMGSIFAWLVLHADDFFGDNDGEWGCMA